MLLQVRPRQVADMQFRHFSRRPGGNTVAVTEYSHSRTFGERQSDRTRKKRSGTALGIPAMVNGRARAPTSRSARMTLGRVRQKLDAERTRTSGIRRTKTDNFEVIGR